MIRMLDTDFLASTFTDLDAARSAMAELVEEGVPQERISVALADSQEARAMVARGPDSSSESAAIGSVVGAPVCGITAVALSGMLAVGSGTALLGGLAAGAGAGGLLGAFVGLGIPRYRSALREQDIVPGGVLITCPLQGQDETRIRALFEQHGALDTFRL